MVVCCWGRAQNRVLHLEMVELLGLVGVQADFQGINLVQLAHVQHPSVFGPSSRCSPRPDQLTVHSEMFVFVSLSHLFCIQQLHKKM